MNIKSLPMDSGVMSRALMAYARRPSTVRMTKKTKDGRTVTVSAQCDDPFDVGSLDRREMIQFFQDAKRDGRLRCRVVRVLS